jgi:dUTP pyrophosphatase
MEKMEDRAFLPTKNNVDDAGYDLAAYETGTIEPWSKAVVGLRIKIAIPSGYYGRIASRSGLSVKNDIEVGAGVIDCGYQDEVKVVLRNFSDNPYTYHAGDRIAQLILSPYATVPIKQVNKISDVTGKTVRGLGGFGSTGK